MQIELHFINDQGDILDSLSFDTIKEAKERVKLTLKHPKMCLDDAAEVEDWHKQVHSIRLVAGDDCHSEWFPKFYEAGAATTPYASH